MNRGKRLLHLAFEENKTSEDFANTADDQNDIAMEDCSQPRFLEGGADLLRFKRKLRHQPRQYLAEEFEMDEPFSPDVSEYIPSNVDSASGSSYQVDVNPRAHTGTAQCDMNLINVQKSSDSKALSPGNQSTNNDVHIVSDNQDFAVAETSTCTESPSTSSATKKYPMKTNAGKKRQRDPSIWKMNVLKRLRNSGQEYENKKGKLIKKKELGPGCDDKCRRKCKSNLSDNDRLNLFNNFWLMADHYKQGEYLCRYVTRSERKLVRLNKKSRRNFTYEYNLQIGDGRVQVCKKTFLNTFDITDMWLTTLFNKMDSHEHGCIPGDLRGRHKNRRNAIDENVKISVREHIQSIPAKESHYVRKRTSRLYFDESLTFPKLYSLYTEWMINSQPDHIVASREQYRQIFNTEFNIGFFVPKKDQCLTCEVQKTSTQEEKEKLKTEYTLHIANKFVVRELKDTDKAASQKSSSIITACYDLQKILTTPQSEVSSFYYKRKFKVYNFTIFDIGSAEGYCYAWDETTDKIGPNELSSALLDFIKRKVADGAEEFRFYSDCCGGQNRNRIIFSMYVYASKLLNINIVHNFFEVGHSQSERDSMHALIERWKKNQVIYIPQQWYTLIRCAKATGKPYDLKELSQNDILDFKSLTKKIPNWDLDQNKQKVFWSKIKHLKICKDEPHSLYFQYDFISDKYSLIDLACKPQISKRSNKNNENIEHIWVDAIPLAYKGLHPISTSKYNDLIILCSSGAIPEQYRSFYLNLKMFHSYLMMKINILPTGSIFSFKNMF